MNTVHGAPYLSGVIEGFYGRPWSPEERLELVLRLRAWGFTSYVYAPKDDIRLRARWREPYGADELAELAELVAACRANGVRFGYAIAPCLDVRYADDAEGDRLIAKVDQLVDIGAQDVVLLFDDVPHDLDAASRERFGSLAAAQAHLSERLFDHLRERVPHGRRIVCPTDYCRRMADASGDDWSYLRTLGERLGPDVDVCWTGDEIVSERIDAASVDDVAAALRRPPLIWDNLHANDYDLRRLHLGPLTGRSGDLPGATAGFLTNPNTPYQANDVAFATLAAYLADPVAYEPERAWLEALAAWRPAFALDGGGALDPGALRLLAELCYLPWSSGPGVEAVLADARALLAAPPDPADSRLGRVRAFADDVAALLERLTELVDRDLLYALYGVVWEARTESRALADYLERRAHEGDAVRFGRPDALANTYRLGFAAAVQALLPLDDAGVVARSTAPIETIRIRPYQRADREALYAVALATGRDGEDAGALFRDPTLLGHRYVGPYLDLEPGLAFTLEDDEGPCGYVLGTADTAAFYARFAREWLPPLLATLGPPPAALDDDDARLLAELHAPTFTVPRDLDAYPAHLHIDLLPRAQGRGLGRRMMETLLGALVDRGAHGVHLGVAPRNQRAQGFYRALGFTVVAASEPDDDTVLMARRLP